MANFTKEMKAERAPAITKLAKEYGVKLSMKITKQGCSAWSRYR